MFAKAQERNTTTHLVLYCFSVKSVLYMED
jgi:hypothetical protein